MKVFHLCLLFQEVEEIKAELPSNIILQLCICHVTPHMFGFLQIPIVGHWQGAPEGTLSPPFIGSTTYFHGRWPTDREPKKKILLS
jgi:hypothetical protein